MGGKIPLTTFLFIKDINDNAIICDDNKYIILCESRWLDKNIMSQNNLHKHFLQFFLTKKKHNNFENVLELLGCEDRQR